MEFCVVENFLSGVVEDDFVYVEDYCVVSKVKCGNCVLFDDDGGYVEVFDVF